MYIWKMITNKPQTYLIISIYLSLIVLAVINGLAQHQFFYFNAFVIIMTFVLWTLFLRVIYAQKANSDKTSFPSKVIAESIRYIEISEIAAHVLHNMGNVLTSINVAASILHEKLSRSEMGELKHLSHLLSQHEKNLLSFFSENPKGKFIVPFIQKLAEKWLSEKEALMQEIHEIKQKIDVVKKIVHSLEMTGRSKGFVETIQIAEIIDEALAINNALIHEIGVTIEKQLSELPMIPIDKMKILQILVNLIKNGLEALRESTQNHKFLLLKARMHEGKKFQIEIIDNGKGISQGDLNKIFTYGFTTKAENHGLGLHSSALLTKELGGTLTINSLGLQKGATVILQLPYNA